MLSFIAGPALALFALIFPTTDAKAQHALRDDRLADVPEVPTSLIDVLATPPNGLGKCHAVTRSGWSHEAQECTYDVGGQSFTITTATPPPERIARWIVDASSFIPSVAALRLRDRAAWEDALSIMAKHTVEQSGGMFPLDGVVWENFEGLTGYVFHDGVTYGTFGGPLETCHACACRIDSLHRSQWCTYEVEMLGGHSYAACLEDLGGETGWNDAWAKRCIENHDRAWTNDRNESYRAMAYFIDRNQMRSSFPDPENPEPTSVVDALRRAYGNPYATLNP